MWTCPKCDRNFKSANQWHMCTDKTIDELFEGKPDNLVLAFDKVLISVIDWEPCAVGMSTKSIVFSKEKAWLIVKPMSKELDLKFYNSEIIQNPRIKKTSKWGNKYAHHIRVSYDHQVDDEVISLLRVGYEFA